jgi:hypothetical protein
MGVASGASAGVMSRLSGGVRGAAGGQALPTPGDFPVGVPEIRGTAPGAERAGVGT